MHGSAGDRRALEREALRNVIAQWNANRLDIFELSEPNEDLEFHGVMRFYFQDSGQKVATKCIRVASDATVEDVIGTLVEKFRPDMRMLSIPSYALYELHEHYPERKMSPDEKPLLVQLNWHVDDREGRFLLKNVDDKTVNSVGMVDSNASFRRKLSKREKKQLKKQEKLSRMRSENGEADKDGVAEKLYTELPETSFTRSISNPEAVMRRRRQQKLERKLQQFRSKDGGPDTGGTLKIYGEALCKDVPYKTLLLSIRDCAGSVVREMLEKYGLSKTDPSQWCLVQVTQQPGNQETTEYVLDDDECPLSILMNAPGSSSIMFHVRRRPADCAPRKRKKKPGALGTNATNPRDPRGETVPILVELGPDGSAPIPGDTARTLRLNNDVMEVGSANGIALQLYGPHIQPRHCVITNTDGVTSLTPCHADAHTYVNGQRIHQTTILMHGSLVKFGHSNTYRFLDPSQEDRSRHPTAIVDNSRVYDRSPRALSPTEPNRENFETTFDLEGNVETVSTASGAREDNRSLGSSSENRLSGYPRGQDPILPAVLEFPEEPQELFLARVVTHLDVTTPTFRLAPAYTLYLCARYRASTHYRPELTPTERAQKLTLLLQHAAKLIRHTVQDRSTESISQAFWLANASELLHFLKSDRHVSAFSVQAQDTLADSVQLAFRNLVACLTDELNSVMSNLMSDASDDHPREIINVLSNAMHLLRKCRVNAALTIQLFSQLFHWISARSLSTIINNAQLCTRGFGVKLFNRLRNLQAWAESQGLELAAECHLAKIVQCAQLLQAPKYTADELAKLSAACFKLNSLQLRALLTQYKGEPGEQVAPPPLLEHAARAAEGVADELARAEGREVKLHEDSAPPLQLLLPDDGFSCDVVQGVPPGLADFLHPLQASGLCRLAAQPTSSGHWTVYMSAPRPPSALSTTQPEVQVIRLHKAGGGMGLSIVAAKGAGQERLGIYIKSVVPGGAADRDGRLAAGDQLLSVDGQSLLGITQEKAAEFLVRTGSVVTLEVAKGGAVYHGLATLLQQPSPTPHRALDLPDFYGTRGSQESLSHQRWYTPPVSKPKNNVFFNSDDSLYKTEVRRCLMIPRIEIECEPEFKLQITDFSEPSPRDVTHVYDEGEGEFSSLRGKNLCAAQNLPMAKTTRSWKDKTTGYTQQKSFSLDVKDIPFIDVESCSDTEAAYLTISSNSKKLRQMSSSLQDLSSSTSSVNSGVHDSNLDLSQIDTPPVKHKNWKSPDEIRQGHVRDLTKRFEYIFDEKKNISSAVSVPDLSSNGGSPGYAPGERLLRGSKSAQELNRKLSVLERESLLQLLQDWSVKGSDGVNADDVLRRVEKDADEDENEEEYNHSPLLKKFIIKSEVADETTLENPLKAETKKEDTCELCAAAPLKRNLNSEAYVKYFASNLKKVNRQFFSEPDLSPRSRLKLEENNLIYVAKYKSENSLNAGRGGGGVGVDLDIMHTCKFRNCIFNSKYFGGANKGPMESESESAKTEKQTEIKKLKGILKNSNEKLDQRRPKHRRFSEVIESERAFNSPLVRCGSLERFTSAHAQAKKKFPDAYVVTKRGPSTDQASGKTSKVVVLRRKCYPKTWKSCSDLKNRQRIIRKCCRYAKTTCPILKSADEVKRKTQSCADFSDKLKCTDIIDSLDRPRRMSERDLPSRIDAERTIPSSKSVPALHHISPGSEQSRTNAHDVFNPGYSRTSSNNSINTNSATPSTQNGANTNSHNLRSRSTHNLHQQDAGFYQNLSVYRNKMPSPQQLGDRTSALRSSQNSLQSNMTNTQQRPSSAYYPNPSIPPNTTTGRLPLHQSIPNLKSPQSMQRIHAEDANSRSGSYPTVNQQQQQMHPPPNYATGPNANYMSPPPPPNQTYQNQNYMARKDNYQYAGGEGGHPNYLRSQHEERGGYGPSGYQQPLHINANGQRTTDERYNAAGLLREDYRQGARGEELMRYSSTNNVRMQEAAQLQQQQQQQQQQSKPQEPPGQDFARSNEMRTSKSEDMLRQLTNQGAGDIFRYASSGNIKAQEMQRRERDERKEETRANNMRGQAKLAEMGEEVRRRQNRTLPGQFHSPNSGYYQQPPYYGQGPSYGPHILMAQNTQSMQNLSLSQHQTYSNQNYTQPPPINVTSPSYQQNYYYTNQNVPTSPGYPKSPPIAPKPLRKPDEPPDLPPASTHPLYSASTQDPPKMSLYLGANATAKSTRDPWVREEQERQSEKRREQVMIMREQQILELSSMPNRSQQQEEHLRVLQLEREFQKRAMEEPEQDDDDETEKDSPIPYASPQTATATAPTAAVVAAAPSNVASKQETPMSILKPGAAPPANNPQVPPQQQIESQAPPPPERGSSYAVMSLRNKEGTKRVSFNDTSSVAVTTPQQPPPNNLAIEEVVREDPNSFIRQAESMLASPTTPTDASAAATATPGVIGAQEVYRDPRTRRLAEQAQQKSQAPVPEKLSFKEKMKMFAMETGEAGRK